MTFGELLRENGDAIVRRWLADALATYPEDAAAVFDRQKDPFANPVGHSLRVGTRKIFDELLGGADDAKLRPLLNEIIKIRAVQQFTASRAVGFVFRLKGAIRVELGKALGDSRFLPEMVKIEEDIDRIALAAFDVFVECREQVCELRINEVKRSVAWVVDKMNERGSDPGLPESNPE